jgi:hypothetical protein
MLTRSMRYTRCWADTETMTLRRKLLSIVIALSVVALVTACSSRNDAELLPAELKEFLASEPGFDTEIRWDAATQMVTIDEFQLHLPNFEKDTLDFLMNIFPVLSKMQLIFYVDGERVGTAAIGVLRQTFLATEGADQILARPWEFEGLTNPQERVTSDATSPQGRRCILEYRIGPTLSSPGVDKGFAVLVISGHATPPLVMVLSQVEGERERGDLGQGVLDAIMKQVC